MEDDSGLGAVLAPIDELIGRGSSAEVAKALGSAKLRVLELASDHLGNRVAAKALTVKVLNLLMAKHDLRSRSIAPWSRPYGLVLDPANGCTLHCPGCVHSAFSIGNRLFDWPAEMLAEPVVSRLFRQYGPYAIQAKFCNYGEPLLNPETPRFIAMARQYLMQTMLSTSLSVRRFDADAYVRSGLDYMVLSIDGATQAVYEKYRRNGNLDLVLANIVSLVEAKRRHGSPAPVLCWQFLAFQHNAHEIDQAIEMARQLGIDEFHVAPPFDVTWDDPAMQPAGLPPRRVELIEEPEARMKQNFHAFPSRFDEEAIDAALARGWTGIEHNGGRGQSCRWLYKNMTMDARGRVFPCCGAPDRTGDLVFAQLPAEADPYQSAAYRQARLWFADRAGHDSERAAQPETKEPFCVRCSWIDSQADIDSAHAASFLRAAGPPLFCEDAVRVLSDW